MAAQTAPAVEDERAMVFTIQAHIVVENVVAPEGLTQTIHVFAREVLLPVDPPEVNTLAFAGTDDTIEHVVIELPVAQVPRHTVHGAVEPHVGAQLLEVVLIVVDTVGGVQVQGDLQAVSMHPVDESFRIGNRRAVPRPAGPALGVPVHIENHHVHRNLIALHVVHNLHELITGVALILAVPVAQNVERRHRLAASHFREVAQCLLVLMTVAQEVPVNSILVDGLCHPGHPIHIAVEGKGGGAVAMLRAGRLVNDAPAGTREQTVLQLSALVVTNLTVERTRGSLQVHGVVLARIPHHTASVQVEADVQHIGACSSIAGDSATYLILKGERRGLHHEPSVALLGGERRYGQLTINDGKRGAVFKQVAVAVLNANHLRREHREARMSRPDDGLGISFGVPFGCLGTHAASTREGDDDGDGQQ